jgi:hypothetical protein
VEREISAERIEEALRTLERHPTARHEVVRPPGEVYQAPLPGGWALYFNFVRPEHVPVGQVYRTWIVHSSEAEGPRVRYFRSRRGANGDETLPD